MYTDHLVITDGTFLELSNYNTYPWVVGVSCIDNIPIEIFWFDLFLSDMTVGRMAIFSPRVLMNYFWMHIMLPYNSVRVWILYSDSNVLLAKFEIKLKVISFILQITFDQ